MPLELFANRVADFLIRSGSATEDIRDICVYGIEASLSHIINFFLTLLVGFIFGIPLELIALQILALHCVY